MGLNRDQPLVDLGQTVRVVAGLAFQHQRRAFGIGGQHSLERRGIPARCFLRDITQPAPARHRHLAGIGLEHPGDHAHQRGLARAIAPDQANAPARRQLRSRIVNDRPPAKANRNAGKVKHGARLAGPGCNRKRRIAERRRGSAGTRPGG